MCCMRIFRLGISLSDCQVFQVLFPPPLAPAMPTPLGAPAPFPCISAAASFRYFTDSFRKRGEIQSSYRLRAESPRDAKKPPFRRPTRAMRARVAQPTSPRGRRHVLRSRARRRSV